MESSILNSDHSMFYQQPCQTQDANYSLDEYINDLVTDQQVEMAQLIPEVVEVLPIGQGEARILFHGLHPHGVTSKNRVFLVRWEMSTLIS